MKLGLIMPLRKDISINMERVKLVESLGFDSVWMGEAWGPDAVTPAAYVLAQTEKIKVGTSIMQMTARAPACTAQSAMTLNAMSKGRFILGLGASGPQVVEGWHGVPFGRPVTRMKEYIEIMRKVMAREDRLEHKGFNYSLPYDGEDGTGLGKPLKIMMPADTSIPIYTASITPKGLEASGEVADGCIPIWMDPDNFDVLESGIQAGLDKSGRTLKDFDVAPFVNAVMGDDIDACRFPSKASMAFYIGGMGAKNKNFYTDYACAQGYEEEAHKIQDLFLTGKREEAVMAVPDELVDACHLVGTEEMIRERLKVWKAAAGKNQVGTMLLRDVKQPEVLEVIADELL
jgi:F420-dependent oxidoreductase-like protein